MPFLFFLRGRQSNHEAPHKPVTKPQPRAPDHVRHDAATPNSPHIERLRARKDGPYFVAPDSVEPLPSGMWADLSPAAVEQSAKHFPQLTDPHPTQQQGQPGSSAALPDKYRKILSTGGPAAKDLLGLLERRL